MERTEGAGQGEGEERVTGYVVAWKSERQLCARRREESSRGKDEASDKGVVAAGQVGLAAVAVEQGPGTTRRGGGALGAAESK
ncbi:unnamed protein product [Linum trigynum]|uniref:Uncharacterized protein n=1 Tax=Linum trigynum TaxID=586398 RepID=A0AAV2EH47_9ROSI